MAKLTAIGSSLGVIIPKEMLEEMGLQKGDELQITRRGSVLELAPVIKRTKLRPKVQEALDSTIERYGPALERLAK